MKFYVQRNVLAGFFCAFAIITWLGVASFINNQRFKNTTLWVAHTNKVLFHAEQLLASIIEMESSHRAYVLTAKHEFSESFNQATDTIQSHLQTLRSLTKDNSDQQARISLLEKSFQKRLLMAKAVSEIRKHSFPEAVKMIASLKGKDLMEEVRGKIKAIQQAELDLLKVRSTLSESRMVSFNDTFIALLCATGVILILVFISLQISLKKRTDAEISLKHAVVQIQDLYDKAPCGYHSLDSEGTFVDINGTWIEWLGYKKEEVIGKKKFLEIVTPAGSEVFHQNFQKFKEKGYIQNLEFEVIRKNGTTFPILLNSSAVKDRDGNYIKSRSTVFDYTEPKRAEEQISLLNKELEAFSYSVSHDLRAPLRSIDGYSRILADDYRNNLDAEGQRLLDVVIKNANKMGKLIDDLLDFSRVGKKEMARVELNMNALVNSVCSDLITEDMQVALNIAELHNAHGDLPLLRQVWVNLISNAIKYSSKTGKSIIDIQSEESPDEVIYKIKDNGVGFDPQYSHKLFGVFQRLHRQQEFDGTGVGLAIVHRVVTRHEGRVWAESKLNEGATFYFSLPLNKQSKTSYV